MATSAARPGAAGATRACPHCRETILESATMCPACKHYLRYGAAGEAAASVPAITPLRVEASIRHPPGGEPWEYTVVVSIRNERGEEIARKLVGVGAMQGNDQRFVTLSIEAVSGKAAPRSPRDARAAVTSGKG